MSPPKELLGRRPEEVISLFTCTCDWSIEYDGWSIADIHFWVDAVEVATSHSETYGWAGGRVDYQAAASTKNRQIYCNLTSNLGSVSASGILLGSGPGSATLKIDAFIRQNWVGNPANIYRIFGGDYRGFAYDQGSSRFTTVYDVFNPAVNSTDVLSGPTSGAGLTEEYDITTSLDAPAPFGNLTQAARDDWIPDPPLKTRWAMADVGGAMDCSIQRLGHPTDATSAHQVHCTANVSDPLVQ
jgi:hypothetical protein